MAKVTAASGELSTRQGVPRAGSAAAAGGRRGWGWAVALTVPLVLFLAVLYAYPVLTMLFRSVAEPSWTLANYQKLFGSSVYAQVLWITVQTALVVTALTLLLGYPLAYLMSSIGESK